MRKLLLQMQISVDGFVGSDGHYDWQLWGWGDRNRWDEELKRDFNAFFASIDTVLLDSSASARQFGHAAARPHFAFGI